MKNLFPVVVFFLTLSSASFAGYDVVPTNSNEVTAGLTPRGLKDLPQCIQEVRQANPKLSPIPWDDSNPWVQKLADCTQNASLHATPALESALFNKLDKIKTATGGTGCICYQRIGTNKYQIIGGPSLSTHENCVGMGGHLCI